MTATGTAATPRKHSQEARAFERAALDRCMHCRQDVAGRLTALAATGLAAAKAIAQVTGDEGPLEHLAALARDRDWPQADRINFETISILVHKAEEGLLNDRSPEGWRRLDGLISKHPGSGATIIDDTRWATSNMRMAHDCLDPHYGPGEDGYEARHHLWNCQIMAVMGACMAITTDPEATAEAKRVIAAECAHDATHQWAREEPRRIREKA